MRAVVFVCAGALFFCASAAQAFVCSRATSLQGLDTGPSLAWFSRTVPFALYFAGTDDLVAASENVTLRRALAVWGDVVSARGEITQGGSQACVAPFAEADLRFAETAVLSQDNTLGYDFLNPEDNENLLVFRDDGWLHPGQVSNTLALTTTTFNAVTGEIIDADVEFNSFFFDYGDCAVGCFGANPADLLNTAVHEVGHMLGFAHESDPDSTMYLEAGDADQSKRDLDCEDINGLVFRYPAGAENGYCSPPVVCGSCAPPNKLTRTAIITASDYDEKRGCGATQPSRGGWMWMGICAGLLLWRRHRAEAL